MLQSKDIPSGYKDLLIPVRGVLVQDLVRVHAEATGKPAPSSEPVAAVEQNTEAIAPVAEPEVPEVEEVFVPVKKASQLVGIESSQIYAFVRKGLLQVREVPSPNRNRCAPVQGVSLEQLKEVYGKTTGRPLIVEGCNGELPEPFVTSVISNDVSLMSEPMMPRSGDMVRFPSNVIVLDLSRYDSMVAELATLKGEVATLRSQLSCAV